MSQQNSVLLQEETDGGNTLWHKSAVDKSEPFNFVKLPECVLNQSNISVKISVRMF